MYNIKSEESYQNGRESGGLLWEGEGELRCGGRGEYSEKATPVAIEDARKLQSYIAAFEAEKHYCIAI